MYKIFYFIYCYILMIIIIQSAMAVTTNTNFALQGGIFTNGDLYYDAQIRSSLNIDNNLALYSNFNLNTDTQVQDLADKHYVPSNLELFTQYQLHEKQFSIGFMHNPDARSTYNLLADRSDIFMRNKMWSNNLNEHAILLQSAYFTNNTAFSIAYLDEIIGDIMYLTISYTPNINWGLYNKQFIYHDDSLLDINTFYYNEYKAIGYGLKLGLRQYIPLIQDGSYGNEIHLGINLDYFGLSLISDYLIGYHQQDIGEQELNDYQVFELSALYQLNVLQVGISEFISNSQINNHNDYTINTIEVSTRYQLDPHFSVGINLANLQYINFINIKHENKLLILLKYEYY